MVWPGKIRGAEWIALLGLCALLAVPGSALSQTEKTAADGAAAAKAKANVEAATVDIDAEKECVTDDPNAEAQRATNHRNAGFVIASAQMIEDAHTQCDVHWDRVETTRFRAFDERVARWQIWPGFLTSPAHLRIAEFKKKPIGRKFIRQVRCREAASASPALCDHVIHPAVKPFCMAWVKLRTGQAADATICADFSTDQQKACKLFFGIDTSACEQTQGPEAMWCGFIQGLQGGGLPSCGAEFEADGCLRDMLMATVLQKKSPCGAVRSVSKSASRPEWATTLLGAQCDAINAGKPASCPPNPSAESYDWISTPPVAAISDVFLRGGHQGVVPVVGVLSWMQSHPMMSTVSKSSAPGSGVLHAICASEITAKRADGKAESQFVTSAGALRKILKTRGAAFTSAIDPFASDVESETTCALTAPWIGVEVR